MMHDANQPQSTRLLATEAGIFEGLFQDSQVVDLLIQKCVGDHGLSQDEVRTLATQGIRESLVNLLFTTEIGITQTHKVGQSYTITHKTEMDEYVLRAIEYRLPTYTPMRLYEFTPDELHSFGQLMTYSLTQWIKKQWVIQFNSCELLYDASNESLIFRKFQDIKPKPVDPTWVRAKEIYIDDPSLKVNNIIAPPENGVEPTK